MVVALRVTAQGLAVTTPLSLALQVWVRVSGQRRALPGLAWGIAVVLPPLPRVWQMMTAVAPPIR